MGTEQSRHKRRNTVPVNNTTTVPYVNQENQKEIINQIVSQNIRESTTAHDHINGTNAYNSTLSVPNKMTRSASTPSYTAHPYIHPRETVDHQSQTPNQHLITSLPSGINPNTKQITKRKPVKLKHRNSLFDALKSKPKAKLKSHQRFASAVPYVHFDDDNMAVINQKPQRKKKKKLSLIRHAFSSDDHDSMDIDIDDLSYHSDPGTVKKKPIARALRRSTTVAHSTQKDTTTDDATDTKNKRKILLLGNGSCGKSTIFKQLKLILGRRNGFDDNELSEATHAIRQNCVSVLLIILHKSTVFSELKECRIDDSNEAIRDSIRYVMKYRSESFEKMNQDLSELSKNIAFLWSLPCVRCAIELRHKRFTIPDNMRYFYSQIECVFGSDYVPSINDMIRMRIRTTGMIESKYKMDQYELSIFDTGGERNERKKWIHTFENVDIVIYVAALSHFCCVLWEDEKTISMHDAIELFDEICNGRWFRRSEMILFLNKNDLFRQMLYDQITLSVGFARDIKKENYKIKKQSEITPPPLPNGHPTKPKTNDDEETQESIPFPNLNQWLGDPWNGPNFTYDASKSEEENNVCFEKCYDKAIEFIVSLFLKQNRDANKTVYVHITTAIDA
eukprot:515782_1